MLEEPIRDRLLGAATTRPATSNDAPPDPVPASSVTGSPLPRLVHCRIRDPANARRADGARSSPRSAAVVADDVDGGAPRGVAITFGKARKSDCRAAGSTASTSRAAPLPSGTQRLVERVLVGERGARCSTSNASGFMAANRSRQHALCLRRDRRVQRDDVRLPQRRVDPETPHLGRHLRGGIVAQHPRLEGGEPDCDFSLTAPSPTGAMVRPPSSRPVKRLYSARKSGRLRCAAHQRP